MNPTLVIELGLRPMLRFQELQRDLRWFRGLWGYCAVHRKSTPCPGL